MQTDIFKSQLYISLNLNGLFIPLIGKPLSKFFALDTLDYFYKQSLQSPGYSFSEKILNALNIKLNFSKSDLLQIPAKGPAIVVANHPFGGIEGVLISALLEKVRADVKIMANYLLQSIPELRGKFIFVNPFNQEDAVKRNIASMRESIYWVRKGGLLVIFPSGTVSHFQLKERIIADPPWKESIGRLIEVLDAPVIPVYFEGHNKLAFQTLGLLHPILRTMRLPYEFINKANQSFNIHIGKRTSKKRIKSIGNANESIKYLRKRTYNLANRTLVRKSVNSSRNDPVKPVAKPSPFQLLVDEVAKIPSQQILFEQKDAVVFYAHQPQIPQLMYEIGRQRELVFRAVYEGTGNDLDLDIYDNYYLHLIAWDRNAQKIIGAYRLGLVDRILNEFGQKGLYTSSLFNIRAGFFDSIKPAIELGRSFITLEYQRKFNSLFLLWRGIGAFISLNPHYRYLFGPVSISNAYHPLSQKMMLEYLNSQHGHQQLSKLVTAKNANYPKFKKNKLKYEEIAYLTELEDLIADLEDEPAGVPILIRQYLKLGAKFVSFNRDKDFSSVLDGLIVVDLMKTEAKILNKYLGRAGASFFMDIIDTETISIIHNLTSPQEAIILFCFFQASIYRAKFMKSLRDFICVIMFTSCDRQMRNVFSKQYL